MDTCTHTETISPGVTKSWTHDEHGHVIEEAFHHDLDAQRADH